MELKMSQAAIEAEKAYHRKRRLARKLEDIEDKAINVLAALGALIMAFMFAFVIWSAVWR